MRIEMRRRWLMVLSGLSLGLAGCQARSDAREVAIAFAQALRKADTAAIEVLTHPPHANMMVSGLPSTTDARLGFDPDHPDVEFRGSSDTVFNFLIRTVSDTVDKEMAGVWVVVMRTTPPRVRYYTLFPDIWPRPVPAVTESPR